MSSLFKTPATDRRQQPRDIYAQAEYRFRQFISLPNIDEVVEREPSSLGEFERALELALSEAFRPGAKDRSRLFLQRILYSVYRLKLFWFDDLTNYANERSRYLRDVRDRIEMPWQNWENTQCSPTSPALDVVAALRQRVSRDLNPPISADGLFYQDQVTLPGYRCLLEIASLDGLVEASQLSRVLGGASNQVHAMLTRLIVEEYGGGQLRRKHSSYFKAMLDELGMDSRPEAYLNVVPWQVLAGITQSFLLSERKRFYLRYIGGLLYFETAVPAAFRPYQAAAERLKLGAAAGGYWALHIREDERHGQWMINDVALPLAAMHPHDAWEIVWGYDQQRMISDRAGAAVTRLCRDASQ